MYGRLIESRSSTRRSAASALLAGATLVGLAGVAGDTLSAQPFPVAIELSELDGDDGVTIPGLTPDDLLGSRVATVGDVNGDGRSDFVVTAPQAQPLFAGEVYLVFGDEGLPATLSPAALDGANGATLRGIAAGESAGVSAAAAGDVDGDGFGDLLVGAPFAGPSNRSAAGRAYLIYGRARFPAVFDLAAIDGANGVTLLGARPFDHAGTQVAGADLDGDGHSDLVVGAHRADPGGSANAGIVYVVFGDEALGPTIDLADLAAPAGLAIHGVDPEDEAGRALATAGDVNGDGVGDLVIAASRADPGGRSKAGEIYVVYGGPSLVHPFELAALDGENGFVMIGIEVDDEAGYAVAAAGDLNGDGFADVAMTAPFASPAGVFFGGETYVVYGGAELPSVVRLAELDGRSGTTIVGVDFGDTTGDCVAGVGDLDNDGFDDLVLGATQADPNGLNAGGEAFVVLGSSALGALVPVSDLDGANGFVLRGAARADQAGFACGRAGDVDGDGLDDLLVGAQTADPVGPASGEAYLVYGRARAFVRASGDCPGALVLDGSGFTLGGSARVVRGSGVGPFVVPAGGCAGELLDLVDPFVLDTVAVDGSGAISVSRDVGPSFCGARLQLVDAATCAKSNVVAVP